MRTKVAKKSVAATVATPSAVAPAVPAAPAAPVEESVAPVLPVAAVLPAVQVQAEVSPVATETDEQATATAADEPKKRVRARPRNRAFDELYSEMSGQIASAYKSLQAVSRGFSSLASAHQREVLNKTHREVSTRTPTTLFDQQLVDYFRARLSNTDLMITRKQGDETVAVDLSNLTTETPVFRTDLTKLYSLVFKRHGLTKEDDHRNITYQKDSELVSLLTNGTYSADLEAQVQQIRDGTLELNIFNIQRFLNHHLRKLERSEEATVASTA